MNEQPQCSELGQEGGQQVRDSLEEMERLLLLLLEAVPLHPQQGCAVFLPPGLGTKVAGSWLCPGKQPGLQGQKG